MASTMLSSPSTPSSRHSLYDYSSPYFPAKSSPLASSEPGGSSPPQSPTKSPTYVARRRSQYKSRGEFSSPTASRRQPSSSRRVSTSAIPFSLTRSEQQTPAEEPTRKTMLRERFKARCIEKAVQDRERKIRGKRRALDLSSDGFDELMDCEDDEDDETVMNDPFFQRIMSNFKHKDKHLYRLSYAQDVGSSFDPDMEDVGEWENDQPALEEEEPPSEPADPDAEELAQMAAERELLEGLDVDDVFSYSDLDDFPVYGEDDEDDDMSSQPKHRYVKKVDEDIDMSQ